MGNNLVFTLMRDYFNHVTKTCKFYCRLYKSSVT
jgi:hypothetical protein